MYCVAVIFEIAPEHAARFLARVVQQSEDSLREEPGCRVFEVWTASETPETVFLYEIYDDAAAFEAHLGSAHYAAFDAEIAPWVRSKKPLRLDRRHDAGGAAGEGRDG